MRAVYLKMFSGMGGMPGGMGGESSEYCILVLTVILIIYYIIYQINHVYLNNYKYLSICLQSGPYIFYAVKPYSIDTRF